ncbi:uncharacterized protein EI97DRAFT_34296 [Westerdykella ornata]|uniref:Uncharacterized protein n=1 Tax=Westerdykella ornata TaxID=318751 RepID=A0A6A6JYD5_WESOR|nr:uncharacterized protein EI97DRAFT_34296 [Westerdykella ornata]KAF2281602.1 hypothetical protein EI97DRAFT_34296 [Westerdykella ornata]
MSSNPNVVDIGPGGQQTPYESAATHIQPHAKQSGVLGGSAKNTKDAPAYSSTSTSSNDDDTTDVGPTVKEQRHSGPAGQTTGRIGVAGGSNVDEGTTEEPGKARREQGYGGESDMDRSIGA